MHFAVLAEPNSFHTRKWTKALLEAGQQVTVFSFSRHQLPDVPCVRIEPRMTVRGNHTYFSYLFSADRLRKALLEHQVDVVNPIDVTPFGVWGRRAGVHPMMAIAMGSDILEYPPTKAEAVSRDRLWTRTQSGQMSWLERIQLPAKRWLFRREVARALKAADFVTGDNRVLVDAVRNWFGVPESKSALNRWGVEPELFETNAAEEQRIRATYGIREGQRLLISPRGIKPIYQGDIILDAMEAVLRGGGLENTRVLMLSAGYAVPPELDRQASALEQDFPQFSLIRKVIPREDMCLLWTLTDAFISAPVYDGYSNALSEGRYIGAIPIVNDTPATREVMVHGEHGVVVDPFTAEKLAEAIREVMADPDSWKQTIAAANQAWVSREAMLSENIRAFVAEAERLCKQFGGSPRNSL